MTPRLLYLILSGPVARWRRLFSLSVLLYRDNLENAAWVKASAGTGTNPTVTDNFEQTGVSRIQLDRGIGDTASDDSQIYQTISGVTSGVSYSLVFEVKATTEASVGKVFNVRHAAGNAYTTYTLSASWQRISQAETSISTNADVVISARGAVGTPAASNTSDMVVRNLVFARTSDI